jgi:hypothetical protein
MKGETVLEIFGENKENKSKLLRCTRLRFTQPIEVHINGKVVHTGFNEAIHETNLSRKEQNP